MTIPQLYYAVDQCKQCSLLLRLASLILIHVGQQRGSLAITRLCQRSALSQVVAYTRQTSALRSTADTLLDTVSYSSRWVLLLLAPEAGVARALRQ